MHFGPTDQKLIELREEYNVNQVDRRNLHASWPSNLSALIFAKIITEASNILKDQDLAIKGNDMELFHFYPPIPLILTAPLKNYFKV